MLEKTLIEIRFSKGKKDVKRSSVTFPELSAILASVTKINLTPTIKAIIEKSEEACTKSSHRGIKGTLVLSPAVQLKNTSWIDEDEPQAVADVKVDLPAK